MLKLAVFLTLATVCFTQPPTPKIPESFMSAVSWPNTCMLRITCVSLAFPLHRVGWNTMTIVEPFLANVRQNSKIFYAASRYSVAVSTVRSVISFLCDFCSCHWSRPIYQWGGGEFNPEGWRQDGTLRVPGALWHWGPLYHQRVSSNIIHCSVVNTTSPQWWLRWRALPAREGQGQPTHVLGLASKCHIRGQEGIPRSGVWCVAIQCENECTSDSSSWDRKLSLFQRILIRGPLFCNINFTFPFTGCWISANTSCSRGRSQHTQVFGTQNWSSHIGFWVQELQWNDTTFKGLRCSKGVYWRSYQPLASLQTKAFCVVSTYWTHFELLLMYIHDY